MNNFWQRTITGVLFVTVLIGGIYYHPVSFLLLFLLIVVAGIHELKVMFEKANISTSLVISGILGAALFSLSFAVEMDVLQPKILLSLIPLLSFLMIVELFRKKSNPLLNIGASLFSVLYMSLPFALLGVLAFNNGVYNFHLPLSVFILVWLNDTGAYLFGVTMGKHKFFERISPKKTWEGTVGGFLITMTGAYVLSIFWADMLAWQWIIFGALISVMAVLGDLIESLFKRSIGIKDSGNILPGHGGILDRFDAVLFAIPMAVFYVELFVR